MKTTQWYFDFISPFAYLQSEQLARLSKDITIEYKPVLFAGLLNHWGHKGPAEIPEKRRFTYRHTQWLAQRHGIAMQMPPAHPFNPLKALRLALALNCEATAIQTIFRFIWTKGRTLETAADWDELTRQLGCQGIDITTPEVKNALRENTEQAVAQGVFGVPTFIIDGELLWGFDATEMVLDYLANPDLFKDAEMLRISDLPAAAQRQR